MAAIFPGRQPEPALAGPEEAARFGKAEQVRRLCQRELEPVEILLSQFAPGVVQELQERRRFLVQAPLQRPLAHAQLTCHLIAPRLAVGQAADDHLAHPVAGPVAVEVLEILPGIAIVQSGQHRVRGGERFRQVVDRVDQAAQRRVERDRTAKGGAVRPRIARRAIRDGDLHWVDVASADPAAERRHRDENELHPLSRNRPFAAAEIERDAVAAALLGPMDDQRVAEHAQVAHQAIERGLQICARHHRVAHHVEARRPHHLRLREPDGGIARSLGGDLPEATDLSVGTRAPGASTAAPSMPAAARNAFASRRSALSISTPRRRARPPSPA